MCVDWDQPNVLELFCFNFDHCDQVPIQQIKRYLI